MEPVISFNDEYLTEKRQRGDVPADQFVTSQFSNPLYKRELRAWLGDLQNNHQLELESAVNSVPEAFQSSELIVNAQLLPEWADPKLMKKGSAFFAKHAEAIMNLLGLLSLPYCYAAADGAMVLQLSERMRNETGKRLFDTADFVWAVMAPDAFEKFGKGFSSILKVRIMHAAARYYTLSNSEYSSLLGLPLNQEDMAGTNLSLSLIVIRGLRKLGYIIPYEDQHAFMHLWNVIGRLLGIDADLLPHNGKQAQRLEAMIRRRQFRPSEHGQSLTKALIEFFASNLPGNAIDRRDVIGLMRFLLGAEVSTILGVSAPELSLSKIKTLRAVNFVTNLKGNTNAITTYNEAFRKFRLQTTLIRPNA